MKEPAGIIPQSQTVRLQPGRRHRPRDGPGPDVL